MIAYGHRFNRLRGRASVLLLCMFGAALGSCVRNDFDAPCTQASGGRLGIILNLPALEQPSVSSRAMDYEKENMLDADLLSVMIIEGNQVVSQAPVVGGVVYGTDRSRASITVRLPENDAGDPIRLCVVANHALPAGLTFPVSYSAFTEMMTRDATAKWPVTQSIPMWGESGEMVVAEGMTAPTIDMYRALARIDVGLDFVSVGGNVSETVQGLSNFKIKSVSVYNTPTQMYVAPDAVPPTAPRVPANSDRDPSSPLVYESLDGVDSYIREIYVPESAVPDPYNAAEAHCLVVGGFYNGDVTETFYRLEFATEITGTREDLPVLRNHRYIFNIKEISGVGYPTPEDAFNNNGAVANQNIGYTLVVLDESIHRIEFKDGHYFGLDNRDLVFNRQAGNSSVVRYQTDLPVSEPITFEWADPASGNARYSISLDAVTRSFTIGTLTENNSGMVYGDLLYVKSRSFSMPIRVYQKTSNLRYAIDCGSVAISGIYTLGGTLGATHYIDLTITAEDRSIDGSDYTIDTQDLEGGHGISFHVDGRFDLSSIPDGDPLTISVRMLGSGTLPQSAGNLPFKLRIVTNSSSGSFCEVTIVPVSPVMNILIMADETSGHGYSISLLTGGSGKVFNNTNNFGPYDHSIVKTAGFNYISSGIIDFGTAPQSNGYKWVTGIGNGGKIADMVYISYPAFFGANTANLLGNYLEAGGVVTAFLQSIGAQYLAERLFNETGFTSHLIGSTYLYPMPANPVLVPDEVQRQEIMRRFEGDPILNGPFGDIREVQIGEDASTGRALGMKTIPDNLSSYPELTIYAKANNVGLLPVLNSPNVMGFKYESEDGANMFFWGDGGLMSSGSNGQPYLTDYFICPFNWNTSTYFPIPRPAYGYAGYRKPVYNSTMFCNAMAWGVRKSNALKARRLDFEDNYVGP